MTHFIRLSRLLLSGTAIAVCTVAAFAAVTAADTEQREFIIEVDGKAAGKYLMTITRQDDGILSMKGQANVSVKHLLGTHTYTFDGVEHWKDGRLLQLVGKCNDNGTKTDVSATTDRDWLRLKVNGQDRNCRWDVWTTSYWLLADGKFHNQGVPLLDADTGKEYVGQLKYVGTQALDVGGQSQTCQHFRVSGGPQSPVNLWYDGQQRLVRQEFTEQGKHVVFVLRAVRR